MLRKVNKTLVKVFGSRNERLIKAYSSIPQQAGELEEQIKQLDDDALKAKTPEFRKIISLKRKSIARIQIDKEMIKPHSFKDNYLTLADIMSPKHKPHLSSANVLKLVYKKEVPCKDGCGE